MTDIKIIKFLHFPLEKIDELCREAEKKGEKVMIEINTYGKESIGSWEYDKETGKTVPVEKEDYTLTGGLGGCQIHSSKDLFQFDNEDMKLLDKETKKELR